MSVPPKFIKWVKPSTSRAGEQLRDSRGRALYNAVLDIARGTEYLGADIGGWSVPITLDESRVAVTSDGRLVATPPDGARRVNVSFKPDRPLTAFRYEGGQKVAGPTFEGPRETWRLCSAIKEQREAYVSSHSSSRDERKYTFDARRVIAVRPIPTKGAPDRQLYAVDVSLADVRNFTDAADWRLTTTCSREQYEALWRGEWVTKVAGGNTGRNEAAENILRLADPSDPRSAVKYPRPLDNATLAASVMGAFASEDARRSALAAHNAAQMAPRDVTVNEDHLRRAWRALEIARRDDCRRAMMAARLDLLESRGADLPVPEGIELTTADRPLWAGDPSKKPAVECDGYGLNPELESELGGWDVEEEEEPEEEGPAL